MKKPTIKDKHDSSCPKYTKNQVIFSLFPNHQTQPAPRGTVNFGYHESKTGKNIVKVEAIDIRKKTGFDKAQCILQNNVIRNLVL